MHRKNIGSACVCTTWPQRGDKWPFVHYFSILLAIRMHASISLNVFRVFLILFLSCSRSFALFIDWYSIRFWFNYPIFAYRCARISIVFDHAAVNVWSFGRYIVWPWNYMDNQRSFRCDYERRCDSFIFGCMVNRALTVGSVVLKVFISSRFLYQNLPRAIALIVTIHFYNRKNCIHSNRIQNKSF